MNRNKGTLQRGFLGGGEGGLLLIIGYTGVGGRGSGKNGTFLYRVAMETRYDVD